MAGKTQSLSLPDRAERESLSLAGKLARWAYSGLISVALPSYYAVQSLRGAAPARAFAERLGLHPAVPSMQTFWLHASSMGESRLAVAMGEALRAACPSARVAITASTETGYTSVAGQLNGNDLPARLPVDAPWCVHAFLDHLQPTALILVETEWWPNILHACHQRQIPVFVINAKVSAQSARRYHLARSFLKPLLRQVTHWYIRSAEDADRIARLGVDPERMEITGSLKLVVVPNLSTSLEMREISPPVFVAGSTRPGEEEVILDAYDQILKKFPETRLWIAPRHPNRFEKVADLLRQQEFTWSRLTQVDPLGIESYTQSQILLIDQMGRLSDLYRLASIAFVGGSLVPLGGHNPVEPVAIGTPVLFGPHMFTQAEAAQSLLTAELGWEVSDAHDIAHRVISCLTTAPQRDDWLDRRQDFFAQKRKLLNRLATDIISRWEQFSLEKKTYAPNI